MGGARKLMKVTLKVALWGTPCVVLFGSTFDKTIESNLKRIGHGDYEYMDKDKCRFAENMS